jgi:hypothetical protein
VFDVNVESATAADEEYATGGLFCNAAGSEVDTNAGTPEAPVKAEGQSFRSRNSGAYLGFRTLFILGLHQHAIGKFAALLRYIIPKTQENYPIK